MMVGGPHDGIMSDVNLRISGRVVYRMAMPATIVDWTVDMLDELPDDGQRYEIIDGELFVTPSPRDVHQFVVGELYVRLHEYLRGSGVGKPVMSPSDVRRGDRTRNRVQPDVYVMRLTEGKRPDYPYELHDLLLAVEVASPSNPKLDYQVKRELYLRENVGEYWIIDPDALNVSRWHGKDDPGDVLSKVIEWHPAGMAHPLVLDLDEFFTEAFA
jgi:Uma2 family endonuclease